MGTIHDEFVKDMGLPRNLLEQNIGKQLTEEDEQFLYRDGHKDNVDVLFEWWVCNKCGTLLEDNHHYCRKKAKRAERQRKARARMVEDETGNNPTENEE